MWKWTTLVMNTGLLLYFWEYHGRFLCREGTFPWVTLTAVDYCTVGDCTNRVISQITFPISFTSKAMTMWTVWEFALKRAPAGCYRDKYKTFDPPAATVEVLHSVCPAGVPLPALSLVIPAKGSSTSPLRFLHQEAALCCRWRELGSDFNAARRLRRVSHCAPSCYQRHKRKKALLTFSYVTQSTSSVVWIFCSFGEKGMKVGLVK